jgi:hypothetical protein
MSRKTGVLQEMFSDAETALELGQCLEAYKAAAAAVLEEHDRGGVAVRKNRDGQMILTKSAASTGSTGAADALGRLAELTKSLGGDQAAAMQSELDSLRAYVQGGNVAKDWTPTNPVGGTGLTAYDLEPMALVLVPFYTRLVNSIPRLKGVGTAHKFKRIDSFTNAGIPGGAANAMPFFSSTQSQNVVFGANNGAGSVPTYGLGLNRPPKISYTGSDHSVAYVELGFSDQVDFIAQFQALGFEDLRSLSQTALLFSHKMGEERADLYGRSSGSGYEGAISAPSGITAVGSGSGSIGSATTYYVYVTALSGPSTGGGVNESVPSTVVNTGSLTNVGQITITVGTEPAGALGYAYYIGTTTGPTNAHFQGTFVGNSVTITTAPTTGGANPSTSDSSANALGYDGFLTVAADPTISGYVNRVNGKFSTTNPGSEIDAMLTAMYLNNAADPDEILMTGTLRSEYNQLMRVGGNSGAASGYRTTVETGNGNAVLGTVVGGHMNPNTGKVVDVQTHRFMPAGCVTARSLTIPVQDSHVPAPIAKYNVQDYMAIQWPEIQMSYDTSTYQIGTLIHHAPAWHGCLLGVQ